MSMHPARAGVRRWLAAILASASALLAGTVHADEYGDVQQLLRAGKAAEAQARAERFIAGKPRDPQMRFLKGVIQTERRDTAGAIDTFTQLTRDFPELAEPYNNLAVLQAAAGRFQDARASLDAAIRNNPAYATAHENLGDVHVKLAGEAYARARQLDAANIGLQPKLAALVQVLPSTAAGSTTASVAASSASGATTRGAAPASVAQAVQSAVRAWAQSADRQDAEAYLALYSSRFEPPAGQSRKAWEDGVRASMQSRALAPGTLGDVAVTGDESRATAAFRRAARGTGAGVRTSLEFVRESGRWLIVREGAGF